MKTKHFPINTVDPMNGIFRYTRKKNIESFIFVNETSKYYGYKPASYLLKHETDSFFKFGISRINEYFEIHFLKGLSVILDGYGLMATTKNVAIPRN